MYIRLLFIKVLAKANDFTPKFQVCIVKERMEKDVRDLPQRYVEISEFIIPYK